jgi:hypothetical protein
MHTSRQKLLDDKIASSAGSSDDKDVHGGMMCGSKDGKDIVVCVARSKV